jgi:hypothetical protein
VAEELYKFDATKGDLYLHLECEEEDGFAFYIGDDTKLATEILEKKIEELEKKIKQSECESDLTEIENNIANLQSQIDANLQSIAASTPYVKQSMGDSESDVVSQKCFTDTVENV